MIRCGMARNLNGMWEEGQLFHHMHEIVQKYRVNFNGESVSDSMCLDGEVTESNDDI